jgi:CheY-like chemotaxis protein
MCHVLVIEDEWLIAGELGDLALAAGATSVAFAETEGEAIASALSRRPALILSDVHLTDGTGPGAVSAITERLGHIPVIFITSSPERCGRVPALAILVKPVQAASVVASLQRALN